MAKKKKKFSLVQKVLLIGGTLILFELGFLFYYKSDQPKTVREAIDLALDKQPGLDERRRTLAKLNMALFDYRTNNEGKLPNNLNALVPKYFDTVPVDTKTNKEYEYRVDGDTFELGPRRGETTTVASAGSTSFTLGENLTEDQQNALIATLDENLDQVAYLYDPTDKRDPFMPFDFSAGFESADLTPLERYDLGQLRLTAVLDGFDGPTALVEDENGIGFTIKKGTKIGRLGGEVVEIMDDKVIIVETTVDFTGQKITSRRELVIRTPDEEDRLGSGNYSKRK